MKIKSIEPIVLYCQDTVERTEADRKNVGGYTGYQVVVRVETDSGLVGWGECCTGSEFGEAAHSVAQIIEKGLRPNLLGEDPLQYRRVWDRLYSFMEWYGRRGIGIFALSGIDTALVDLAGKSLDVPAHVLMGGRYRDEVDLYASLLFDMDDPDATARKAVAYVRDGYFGVKYGWGMSRTRPFGVHAEKDENIVARIREEIGVETKLMVDVGRYVNWTVPYAISMAKRLQKYDIFWLEEALPQDSIQGFEELTSSVDVTIAAGEGYQTLFDFRQMLVSGALDLIQPDPSKLGGISEAKRVIELARIFERPWVPHNWSTAINTAASLQLVASSPDGFLLEYKKEPNPLVHKLLKHELRVEHGKMKVPTEPGLGIEVDEDVVTEYSVGPGQHVK